MVKAGLLHNFARSIIRADKIRAGLQKSASGQKYSRLLQSAATEMAYVYWFRHDLTVGSILMGRCQVS